MNTIPTEHDDPINAKILSVSEDLVSGSNRTHFRSSPSNPVSIWKQFSNAFARCWKPG